VALKTKGIKAGPKKRRAKSEAEAIRKAIEENARGSKPSRKASRVRTYHYKAPNRNRVQRQIDAVQRELALMYQMRVPTGLSLRAQWMELHLPGYSTWDWWHLYDDDKSLWPFIVDIARDELPFIEIAKEEYAA
jgi:hypothetical protein